MRRQQIPVYPLSDYGADDLAASGVHLERLEDSLARRPNRLQLHRHPFFELFWLQGAGAHFNDFTEHRLHGRSLILVSPGQVHGWPDRGDLRGLMIAFTGAFFDGREPPPGALAGHPLAWSPRPVMAPAEPAALDAVLGLLDQEFHRRAEGWREVLRAGLQLALALTARHEAPEPAGKPRSADLVQRFRFLLEEKFRSTTAVSDYARLLGVTAGHLNDTLRERTGQAASALIRERVLLEARRLLLHSELQIAEIAYQLGFDDPSYFARFFRREDGRPPGDFRNEIREKYPSAGESSDSS